MLTIDILRTVLDSAEVGLYVTDYHTSEILFINQNYASYAGLPISEILGKKCWELLNRNGEGRCDFCPYKKLIDENGIPTGKYTWEFFVPSLGIWLKAINEAIYWVDGRLAQISTFNNITETKEIQNQLEGLAYFDQGMQLKNGMRLEQDIQQADIMPSFIVFDITSLHKVNEAYGRLMGDKLLEAVRDWIFSLNIAQSELYRIGGDEFCLSICGVEPGEVKELADILLDRFSEPWRFDNGANGQLHIFISASVAIILGRYVSASDSFLNLVERTLKVAKVNEKVTVYDEELNKNFKEHLQLELSLKKCVREDMDGFEVYYQAIADPVTGTWCGLEALCRWNCPIIGNVSPHTFIPEAERLNLIGVIGLWVLKTSVRKCKEWGLDKHKNFILDVNLSAVQFSDEKLMVKIMNVLEAYDFPPEKLSIEITESTQFTFTDLSLNTIEYLRSKNVQVALDDFGTGYSSFNNLNSLPINILKIERVFVMNIETDSYQRYLFHVMAELAHTVGMKLIAEGVETKEQMDILLKNGADLLQGYLFSKPIPPDELEKKLHRFYEIDETFSIVRNRKVDMSKMLEDENGYIVTPSLYKLLNKCLHAMFYYLDLDEAVYNVLKNVGTYMEVSRAYLFFRDEENIFTEAYEWCADGIASQKAFFTRSFLSDYWVQTMMKDGIIYSTDISAFPAEDLARLPKDIKALVVLPLWDEKEIYGFIGFDDCVYYRDWRTEEILMLYNICVIITNAVNKRKLTEEITLLKTHGI